MSSLFDVENKFSWNVMRRWSSVLKDDGALGKREIFPNGPINTQVERFRVSQ